MLSPEKLKKVRRIEPASVAALFQVLVCDRSLAGNAGLNAAGVQECLSLVSVVRRQVDVFASG